MGEVSIGCLVRVGTGLPEPCGRAARGDGYFHECLFLYFDEDFFGRPDERGAQPTARGG